MHENATPWLNLDMDEFDPKDDRNILATYALCFSLVLLTLCLSLVAAHHQNEPSVAMSLAAVPLMLFSDGFQLILRFGAARPRG